MTDMQAPMRGKDTLCLPLELKTTDDADRGAQAGANGADRADWGTFEGYGSVFGNQDRDGDIVARGAFADSLKAGLPALLWQHDQKSPIGRFDVVREDKRGLYVKGRLSMSGRGREAYDLLKMGALNGLSIGFVTKEASRDKITGARTIVKASLMEVSLVTFPANELARVEAVKSTHPVTVTTPEQNPMISDTRTFERLLRDNGFSRTRAKAITAKGFKASGDELADIEIEAMVRALNDRELKLKTDLPLNRFFERLMGATRIRPTMVRLFPGQSKTVKIMGIKLGKVTFSVNAPSFADWECDIAYYDFSSGRPVRLQEALYLRKGESRPKVTVNRGKIPKFNVWSLSDWKKQFPEQLVLDSTLATFRYLRFNDPSIDDLPQRAVPFSLRVGP
jgi:HK97 family phage prohead protease